MLPCLQHNASLLADSEREQATVISASYSPIHILVVGTPQQMYAAVLGEATSS